jgi:hypothetical protein
MSGKQDIPKPKMDDAIKNWQLITDKNMNILILFGLIFAGIFIKLFLGNNTSENSGQASSTIWGYGLTTIALFTLMFTILSSNNGNILELIFKNGLPIFALIIILIYIISINFTYFKILNKNFVPNEFHTYSTISSILILFQLFILYRFANSLINKSNSNSNILNLTWVFSIINFIIAVIMNIILKYFTTDG